MAKFFADFNKKTVATLVATVFLLALDRLLKMAALLGLERGLIGSWFGFRPMKNYFIAFSLPLGGVLLEILVAALILVLLWLLGQAFKAGRTGQVFWLSLVVSGAVSNLYDRLAYGYVIDYFDLRYFTVFNMADALIFCGVVGLIWLNKTAER